MRAERVGPRSLRTDDPTLLVRCPVCHADLDRQAGSWTCSGSEQHRFPIVGGVPVLLNPGRSIFREEDFTPKARTTFKDPPSWALRLGRWMPSPSRDVSAKRCRRRVAEHLRASPPERRRVLVVGCGDGTEGYGEVAGVPQTTWLETDVSLAGHAKIVCDASDLPFEDCQFDLVICIAVLEHVLEPQRCVDEIRRVLRPDGWVYATTPFMQQVHMGEYDFTRFTHSGHRWLFRQFDEVDSGVATGPASVLVWSVEYFLLSWTRSVLLRRIFKGLTRLSLGWLTWLDLFRPNRAGALDAAGGFYFIGRRAAEPVVSPRSAISYYRGADAAK